MRLWAWRVDGRLAAPVLLLNVEGYWDRLLRMSVRMAASGFLDPGEAVAVRPVADAEEFFALTRGLRPAAAAPVSVAAAAR
jgi:predicted Rossmann-fold nucleotide-binding protein